MKHDFYAQIFDEHETDLKNLLGQIKNDKNIKLKNLKAVKKQNNRWETIYDLKNIAQEPIKSHLLFFELKDGKDSSWKNVLVELYRCKKSDYEGLIATNEKYFSKIVEESFNDTSITRLLKFSLTLTSSLYTAAENKFYSIDNQLAKERPTRLLIFKGSSLKGALRQAAIERLEDELLGKNYGIKFKEYTQESEDAILDKEESSEDDRFFFIKRADLVRLFGNEKDIKWFTFKSLLATGGIRDTKKIEEILNKISVAFERYLKKNKIVNSEGVCRGRFILSDFYFTKVALDVITPLKRDTRTPVHGPIYYEIVPAGESTNGTIIWFPFDLIAKCKTQDEIDEEWGKDKEIIKKAFERLQQSGIGAKTKDGWGRFKVNWENE